MYVVRFIFIFILVRDSKRERFFLAFFFHPVFSLLLLYLFLFFHLCLSVTFDSSIPTCSLAYSLFILVLFVDPVELTTPFFFFLPFTFLFLSLFFFSYSNA